MDPFSSVDQQGKYCPSIDDELMIGSFDEALCEYPNNNTLAQISSYYQQKIARDIDEMAKHFAESLSIQEMKPIIQSENNYVLNKHKALIKIQNVVSFITNLIHKTE